MGTGKEFHTKYTWKISKHSSTLNKLSSTSQDLTSSNSIEKCTTNLSTSLQKWFPVSILQSRICSRDSTSIQKVMLIDSKDSMRESKSSWLASHLLMRSQYLDNFLTRKSISSFHSRVLLFDLLTFNLKWNQPISSVLLVDLKLELPCKMLKSKNLRNVKDARES